MKRAYERGIKYKFGDEITGCNYQQLSSLYIIEGYDYLKISIILGITSDQAELLLYSLFEYVQRIAEGIYESRRK